MKPTPEQLARLANQQAAAHFASHDPLRVALVELLQPVAADDGAIIDRVRYLMNAEKALGTWRDKGLPF